MSRWFPLIALLLLGLAWTVSVASGYDPAADVDVARASQGPSMAHLLGTDHLGRDVAWRLLSASQAFLWPGMLACAIALGLGTLGGAAAGWLGGPLSVALRYAFTVVASVPRFVLALLLCSIHGASVWVLAVAAGLAYVPTVGEAVNQRIEGFRRAEFVLAAEAHGVPPLKVLLWHLLWVNCRALLTRHAMQLFAFFLLLETTLSYIGGFGVAEPQPSWGNMVAFEWGVREGNLWAVASPALATWGLILALLVAADRLSDPSHA